jgi:hypothetical protein
VGQADALQDAAGVAEAGTEKMTGGKEGGFLMKGITHHFRKRPKSVQDIVVISVLSILVFAFSASFDLFNAIIAWVYRHDTWQLDELFSVSVFLVVAIAVYAWRRNRELAEEIRRREQAEAEKASLIPELESALADVHALKKLLPFCTSCRRVREDSGYWNQVEGYMESHFSTRLDGGLCPDCARRFYGNGFAGGISAVSM